MSKRIRLRKRLNVDNFFIVLLKSYKEYAISISIFIPVIFLFLLSSKTENDSFKIFWISFTYLVPIISTILLFLFIISDIFGVYQKARSFLSTIGIVLAIIFEIVFIYILLSFSSQPINIIFNLQLCFVSILIFYIAVYAPNFLGMKEYLARTEYFLEEMSQIVLFQLSLIFFLSIFSISNIISNIPENINVLIIRFLDIIGSVILIFLLNKYVNTIFYSSYKEHNVIFYTYLVFILIDELISYSFFNQLDFRWLSLLVLIISIYYIKENPTKIKTHTLIILGYLLYTFFLTISLFIPIFKQGVFDNLFMIIEKYLPIISIVFSIIELFEISKIKLQERKISNRDVENAINEIVKKKGLDLNSIYPIINICIRNRNFRKLHEILDDYEIHSSDKQKESQRFFRVLLYCVEYSVQNDIYVRIVSSENIKEKRIKNNEKEFLEYISGLIPRKISDYDLWISYTKSHYISIYLDKLGILIPEPPSPSQKLGNFLLGALYFIIAFALFFFFKFELFTKLFPEPSHEFQNFYTIAKNDLQLNFADIFELYKNKDSNISSFYINSIDDWCSQNLSLVSGEKYDEESNKCLDLYNKVIAGVNRENFPFDFYYYNYQAANILFNQQRYLDAIPYYTTSLNGFSEINDIDNILVSIASSYHLSGNDLDVIILLSGKPKLDQYQKSLIYLGYIYFLNSQNQNALYTFEKVNSSNLGLRELAVIEELNNLHLEIDTIILEEENKDISFDFLNVHDYYVQRAFLSYFDKDLSNTSRYFFNACKIKILFTNNLISDQILISQFANSLNMIENKEKNCDSLPWYILNYFNKKDWEDGNELYREYMSKCPNSQIDYDFLEYLGTLIH